MTVAKKGQRLPADTGGILANSSDGGCWQFPAAAVDSGELQRHRRMNYERMCKEKLKLKKWFTILKKGNHFTEN
jgi:hypothetical protein